MKGRLKLALLFSVAVYQLDLNAWVPRGTLHLNVDPECRHEKIEDYAFSAFGEKRFTEDQAWDHLEKQIQKHFNRCEKVLRRKNIHSSIAYVEMQTLSYDYLQNPNIQEIQFIDPIDGSILRGHLALQPGKKKRPLVIFKCGLQCNLGDASTRSMLMLLYDSGPFHVLLLPSSTGTQYQKDNKVFTMGGLDEGRQITKIAQLILTGKMIGSEKVSRIHLIGASLGGHAAAYATLYSDYFDLKSINRKDPLFSSVLIGCPVIDLKDSIQNVTRSGLWGSLFKKLFVDQILFLADFVPFIKDEVKDPGSYSPSKSELRDLLTKGALKYYQDRSANPEWSLDPLKDAIINSEEDLWYWNSYHERPLKKQKTPFWVWAPKDDNIVRYNENAAKLFDADKNLNRRKVYKLDTNYGQHCAFSATFNWQTSVSIFSSILLARSPELLAMRKTRHLEFPTEKISSDFRASMTLRRQTLTWNTHVNKNLIILSSQMRHQPCRVSNKKDRRCEYISEISFSYEDLGFDQSLIPKDAVSQQALTRWFNTNVRVYGKTRGDLRPFENPKSIEIISFE